MDIIGEISNRKLIYENIFLYRMVSFYDLGKDAGTDKIHQHGYHRFYPRFIEHLRKTATGILEIGIKEQNSINLWQKYFLKAHIYGIDIGKKISSDPRTTLLHADQSKLEDLNRAITGISHPIQFIIDDGSHLPDHQVLTFNLLFEKVLQPGGIYIVEDIETSYWSKGAVYGYQTRYGLNHENSFIERAKPLIDMINSEFLTSANKEIVNARLNGFSKETLANISTMTFAQNCVIITKKTAEDNPFNNRNYRYRGRL